VSTPDVSVVVPVYNTMPYLAACLDSLVDQSIGHDQLHVVAVDDGSTDGSGEELDRYAARHPDLFTVVHQANSGGPARPCNVGLEHASGRYVFFLGADDYLDLEALERMVAAADAWGSDVLCARLVGVGGRWVNQRLFTEDQESVPFPSEVLASALSNTKLFRRAVLEEHGIRYALDLRVGSDQPFTIDAMRHARKISVLADRPYYFAVRREDSQNITYTSSWRARLEGIGSIIEHVAALLPEGEGRDAILGRHFSGEVATVLRRDFGEVSPEEQEHLVAGVDDLAQRFLTDGIRDRLKPLARVRYELARQRDLDGLRTLRGAEDGELFVWMDGKQIQQAPAVLRDRLPDPLFRVPADAMPGPAVDAFGSATARMQGSRLVIEGPTTLLPVSGSHARGWLAPAANRAAWGPKAVDRVEKPPPRSSPLDLGAPGTFGWSIDLATLTRAVPGTAWTARLELDAGPLTWRLPIFGELTTPGTYQRDGQTVMVRSLPDEKGRLLIELESGEDPSD